MKKLGVILVYIIFYSHLKANTLSINYKSSLPLFIITENKDNKQNIKRKKKLQNFKTYLWGYPIYDDSPFKLRRQKVYPNFEYGELRKSQDFDYVISTNIGQKNYKIHDVGYLYTVDEMGTGKTDDGMGICTLMGAKRGHFAFKYNGYLCHFHGIKNYLRFLINRHYPGAKVTLISEHWIDPIDMPVCLRHSNIPFTKIGYQRRLIHGKYDYIYENDKNKRIYKGENKSNVWAFYNDPQMLT
ncbi:conserved Plasmodium protein, unknown function [Plasmodium malariae]|uniref:Uncharacterized protein n=1 Tax=Plasmodium malariae TaxID=5858 RepID=A0A1A8VYB0_PLAMA|nr:conserved Plasmodium protein, unknown function [Plasmodium malariae]